MLSQMILFRSKMEKGRDETRCARHYRNDGGPRGHRPRRPVLSWAAFWREAC